MPRLLTTTEPRPRAFQQQSRLGAASIAVENRKVDVVHVCLKSTGGFEGAVALDLHEHGHIVSVVNPSRIKAFSQSELLRTKTDAVDAALIARLCKAHLPDRWLPPAPEILALQALDVNASIRDMLSSESSRLDAVRVENAVERSSRDLEDEVRRVTAEIDELIKRHPPLREQRDLLTTIPGIADLTASRILGEMPNISEYRSARAVAAFAASHHASTSPEPRGRTRLSKTGNSRLRRMLYFPAMSAAQHNPILKAFTNALLPAGKPKVVALAAVM